MLSFNKMLKVAAWWGGVYPSENFNVLKLVLDGLLYKLAGDCTFGRCQSNVTRALHGAKIEIYHFSQKWPIVKRNVPIIIDFVKIYSFYLKRFSMWRVLRIYKKIITLLCSVISFEGKKFVSDVK
jgi:hypothetical protein